ncbi:MAG: serine hydrolase [Actinomycetota bacterium]
MTSDERLQRGIEKIAAEVGGVVGVAVRDITRGRALDLLADEVFPSASVIKVPIMVELMAQVEAGEVSLDDRIALRDAHRVDGSGVLPMLHEGLELTLNDLAHLMITVSDNTASNMLIDLLTCERINSRLVALGLTKTQLQRKFYDFRARAKGHDNWASAGELADLLTAIERRQVVSPAACDRMLAIMRRQQFDSKMPRLLPAETVVANKTGTISTASHDIGIIYAPAGPLALAVLTRDISEPAVAEGGIRHIARLVYNCWGTH